jgi:hypothetical protein
MNGIAGLLGAFFNTWAIQGGNGICFNKECKVTLSVIGGCAASCFLLTFVYQWKLVSIRREHQDIEKGATLGETANRQGRWAVAEALGVN